MNARIEWIDESPQVLGRLGVSDECRNSPGFQACINAGGTEEECEQQECATGTRIPIDDIEKEDQQDYPWMRKSQLTCQLQANINSYLRDNGYVEIEEDCALGAKTCGAARAMAPWTYAPMTCREFEEPVLKDDVPQGPPPEPEPPTCAPDEQLDLATGQCVKVQCPQGQVFDPGAGQCVRIEGEKVTKAGMPWGLFALGAAVAAAVYFKYAG